MAWSPPARPAPLPAWSTTKPVPMDAVSRRRTPRPGAPARGRGARLRCCGRPRRGDARRRADSGAGVDRGDRARTGRGPGPVGPPEAAGGRRGVRRGGVGAQRGGRPFGTHGRRRGPRRPRPGRRAGRLGPYRAAARDAGTARVRAQERELLARELHDTVAHHVSGIAVQAQAGQALAAGGRDERAASCPRRPARAGKRGRCGRWRPGAGRRRRTTRPPGTMASWLRAGGDGGARRTARRDPGGWSRR